MDDKLKQEIEFLNREYKACALCPANCRVNRLEDELGVCGVGRNSKIFNNVLLTNETQEIAPTYAIYFAGCNISCKFCSVMKENKKKIGSQLSDSLIQQIRSDIEITMPKTISFIGGEPSIHLLTILELIQKLEPTIPLVFYSNMYYHDELNHLITNIFDRVIIDIHFGNDKCAYNIAGAKRYFSIVTHNILRIKKQLILRHLLLPEHLDCCFKKIAEWISRELPEHSLYLLTNYFPYNSNNPINRRVEEDEILSAITYAENLGLEIKTLDILRKPNEVATNKNSVQEITIDKDGFVVFKYVTGEAVKLARALGGQDD